MWSEVYRTAFSGILSSRGLLHSDWLPPNRVIAHYHKVDLTSTLLDAHTIQNVPHHSRCWLALKINDFRPLRRSRRRWCKHTLNKAALRCAYEHGGKRKRKCHLKFSEESSLQILIHITPLPPIHYLYFSSYISSIVNSDLVLPATVFSLFVSMFCVSVLC